MFFDKSNPNKLCFFESRFIVEPGRLVCAIH